VKTLIKVTTVPESLMAFSKGHGKLLNKWFNVIAISSEGDNLDAFSLRENIRIIPINMHRRISVFADLISVYRMFKAFRKENPFIVHSMTPKAGLVAMLAGFFAGVPHRIHTFTGLIFPTEKGLKQFILINIDRLICLLATKIIPEGNGVKRDLIEFRITRKDLNVIANGNFNGIDLDYFNRDIYSENEIKEFRKKYSFSTDEVIYVFIGRMVHDKGIEELVRAFSSMAKEHINARLLLIGYFEKELDPVSPDVVELINNGERITYLPFQEDIRPFLAISDVFVFPSYREGFPNSVLEAGAMGLPCIVTNINGSNEIIKDGVNGVIVSKKNVHELEDALVFLYCNLLVRDNMSKVARQMISSRYDRNLVQQELLKMYLELE
jgi:glycosyltransferase involved in cell wall biosynthesis